jgi:hypothetical protein
LHGKVRRRRRRGTYAVLRTGVRLRHGVDASRARHGAGREGSVPTRPGESVTAPRRHPRRPRNGISKKPAPGTAGADFQSEERAGADQVAGERPGVSGVSKRAAQRLVVSVVCQPVCLIWSLQLAPATAPQVVQTEWPSGDDAAELDGHVVVGGFGLGGVPAARCPATSSGACPCRAYQAVTMLKQINPKGTVRSTARRVRLRASPTPMIWRAAAKACSMPHRDASRATRSSAAESRSVVTNGSPYPGRHGLESGACRRGQNDAHGSAAE